MGLRALPVDGRHLVTAHSHGLMLVWDMETGQILRQLDGHVGNVQACELSPDGNWLVSTGADRTGRVWQREDRRAVRDTRGPHGRGVGVRAARPRRVGGHRRGRFDRAHLGTAVGGPPAAPLEPATHGQCGPALPRATGNGLPMAAVTTGPRRSGTYRAATNDTCCPSTRGRGAVLRSSGRRPLAGDGRGDGTALIWDTVTEEKRHVLAGHDGPIWSCRCRPAASGSRPPARTGLWGLGYV